MTMSLTAFEASVLDRVRRGAGPLTSGPTTVDLLLEYALVQVFDAAAATRQVRLGPLRDLLEFKTDGSPVSKTENEIEARARAALTAVAPDVAFIGEETGGGVPEQGFSVALDPIDGTWALVNRTGDCACSITVYEDGRAILGVIANPATGEVGYVAPDGRSRLLQLGLFGEPDQAHDLPLDRSHSKSVLVNVHARRAIDDAVRELARAWSAGSIHLVKTTGGSPSLCLLDAAKGAFVYLNAWAGRPSEAFDLGAGIELVRGAGGDVVDLQGNTISAIGHRGPFVAGLDPAARVQVIDIVRPILTG